MTQVLEYIKQNYTLFLVGAIVILLAVIGYYADKTNFGQGKSEKSKDEKKPDGQKKLENARLMDVANGAKTNSKNDNNSNVQNNSEKLVQKENSIVSNINHNENVVNDKTINIEKNSIENKKNTTEVAELNEETVNQIKNAIHKELNLVSNDAIFNTEEIKNKETKNKKREDAFNKFSNEFDALLPKREIINDDLLSEIEDLELGKTQKFDLRDLKSFDNIKLPRISDTVTEDKDIWNI